MNVGTWNLDKVFIIKEFNVFYYILASGIICEQTVLIFLDCAA